MNQPEKINFREVNIEDKTDRLTVWNNNRFNFEAWKNEKRKCQFWSSVLYQSETKPYNLQTKRLWIYVNNPENKLKYIFEFNKGNSLQELQKYKHKKSGKYLFVPKPTRTFVYVSSYLELVKDIITEKIS